MANDGDLSVVRSERGRQLKSKIPKKFWPNVGAHSGGGYGGGCVPWGTLIDTPGGPCPVELLRPGDSVLSMRLGASNELVRAPIEWIVSGRSTCCVRLGNDWIVTPRQPVYTSSGWLPAGELKIGDRIMDGQGRFLPVENPELVEGYFEIFHLHIGDRAHDYIANGLLCHNVKKK